MLLLFLGVLTFTFFNCEYDEKANTLETESVVSKNFTVKNLHFEEISTNKNLLDKLKTLEGKKEVSNIGNRIVYSGENDFYIDTNYVKYIERESGKHSYTFLLKRDSTNVLLENLVLSLNLNGEYDLHIVQYDINQYELEQLKIGQSPDLSNKTTVLQIDDNTLISTIFSKVVIINEGGGDCLLDVNFVEGKPCGCDGFNCAYGDPNCQCYSSPASPDQWIYTWGDCGDGGGGGSGSGSSSGGGGGGSGSGTGSSNNDDGSSVGDNCRGCGGNEIDTAPLPDLEEENEEETPCDNIKNGTNSPEYKQKFKDLNTTENFEKDHETGFYKQNIGGTEQYVDGTPNSDHTLHVPADALDATHVHNNIPETNEDGTVYDAAIKMLSPGDLIKLIFSIGDANGSTPENGFVVMISSESIFAINITQPIGTLSVEEKKFLREWRDKVYEDKAKYILREYSTINARKEQLQKLFLKGLEATGLTDKVALFEGEVENEDAADINDYNIKWTQKELKKTFFGSTIEETPCN